MSATYNAVDVRSSAQPSRNDNWWVTMLFAVAAASPVAPGPLIPGATTEPRTAVGACGSFAGRLRSAVASTSSAKIAKIASPAEKENKSRNRGSSADGGATSASGSAVLIGSGCIKS